MPSQQMSLAKFPKGTRNTFIDVEIEIGVHIIIASAVTIIIYSGLDESARICIQVIFLC